MASGIDSDALTRPLSDEAPCGVDLEDTQQMAAIDAFRVFGQAGALSGEVDWRAIKEAVTEALGTSRDFRLLAHLAAATLRLDGLASFVDCLTVANTWLAQQFDAVFPRIDDDAVLRKNALNYFADRMAIVDALRRVPIVSDRQVGTFSLRDLEIATGKLTTEAGDGAAPPTEALITAAFAASDQETLKQFVACVTAGESALKSIEAAMVAKHGVQAAPDCGPLRETLAQAREAVAKHVRAPEITAEGGDAAAGAAGGVPGAIRSRDDAVRTLDAVAEYFRRAEPSSPVPLFVERAKRLISRNFLEVLADLVPEALPEVKKVGGVRDD